jgi:hypothetical protein
MKIPSGEGSEDTWISKTDNAIFTKVNVKLVLFVFISISYDVNLAILRNTMGVTSEAGSSYLFGAPDYIIVLERHIHL